ESDTPDRCKLIISGTNKFIGNRAGEKGGAIYSNGNITISGESKFKQNEAGFSGGAIYALSNLTISGEGKFEENFAGEYGGAIYARSNLNISGESKFKQNKAGYLGGAIYSEGDVTISGEGKFEKNEAEEYGGAIYALSNLTISASTGNIIFQENKSGEKPIAIYMDNSSNKILDLSAVDGKSITFFDTIANNENEKLTIDINKGNYTGTVLFDMSDYEGQQKASRIRGNTTVYNGTLELKGGANYATTYVNDIETYYTGTSFTLENLATLKITGSNNRISSEEIELNGNLTFDLIEFEAYSEDDELGEVEVLLLTGKTIGTPQTINIITGGTIIKKGQYILINEMGELNIETSQLFYNDLDIEQTLGNNENYINITDTMVIKIDSNRLILAVSDNDNDDNDNGGGGGVTRGDLIWASQNSENDIWNLAEINWIDDNYSDTNFSQDDNVLFDDTASTRRVVVEPDTVHVGTMNINVTGYTFSGGKIAGNNLILQNNGETIFKNEINFDKININQNHTLTLLYTTERTTISKFNGNGILNKDGNGKLILSANNAISGNLNVNITNGELELTGSNNIAGTINIARNTTLIVNDSGNSKFSGIIDGAGNLEKQGTGQLTLTGNNTATGNFNHNKGTVNLRNNWNGNYYQETGTIINLGNSTTIAKNADFAGTVNLDGKLTVGGNLTYKNTSNTDSFNLTGINNIIVGETFTLAKDTKMNLTLAENKIKANSVEIEGEIHAHLNTNNIASGRINDIIVANVSFSPDTLNKLDNMFVTSEKLLVRMNPFYDDYDSPKRMGVEFSFQTAEEYTSKNRDQFRGNEVRIAGLLDGYEPAQPILWSLDTSQQLKNLIKPLLITELSANAQMLSLHHPYFRVFNHINNLQPHNTLNITSNNNTNPTQTTLRGQQAYPQTSYQQLYQQAYPQAFQQTPQIYQQEYSPTVCLPQNKPNGFWCESYYVGGNVHTDTESLGYKMSHNGIMIGLDRTIDNKLLAGAFFGYGNPQAHNSVGKIQTTDCTFGAYGQWRFAGIHANTFLAYGSQHYKLQQNLNNTKYNGDSLYASLELLKPIYCHNNFAIAPLIAIDFQKAWTDGFNINVTEFPLAIDESEISQTMFRVGFNSNYQNIRTRLQYSYQFAGNVYSISPTSIVGGKNKRNITSVNLGRNSLNAGLGVDFKIYGNTKLFADYDLKIKTHTITHSAQIGLITNF
ncbi:MAG: autotransporter domain-containing protein, partial [Planctomycetaceae bacterium]|nr:autotransporter domain-containing protein [Planctomycetaceae bacterium]